MLDDIHIEKQFLHKIGKRIRSIRLSKKIRQNEIAYRCNFDKSSFNNIEAGKINIYNHDYQIQVAYTKLAQWFRMVKEPGFKSFNIVANSISLNYKSILNYFVNRSTNASAESFNAKIKAFRAQFRGVRNIEYFLYRLTRIFA